MTVAFEQGLDKRRANFTPLTPVSFLEEGTEYVLQRWEGGDWVEVERFTADAQPRRFDDLTTGALYWLVKSESRRLERVFTIESGRQRWW